MALRTLMLESKIKAKRNALKELEESKGKELKKRDKKLQEAIKEMDNGDATDEEISVLDDMVSEFEKDKEEYDKEKETLEQEIEKLESELGKEKEKKPVETQGQVETDNKERSRNLTGGIEMKRGFFAGMDVARRSAILEREDTKEFCERMRKLGEQKRSVKGEDLTIPETVLEIMRDNLERYSKLLKHVTVKKLKGKARQHVMGSVPEGVWMEMKDALKELEISFNQVEMDGYKVGGFIAIPNSVLEDSDLNMLSEVLDILSQAIGLALDKAILYGTGKKMPMGIVTRLAQTTEPENWDENDREWENLSGSNVNKFSGDSLDGAKFFKSLIENLGAAKEKYSDGRKFWAMNSTTKTKILSAAITFDASGTVVSSVNNEMPVIGGKIETFDFMKDGDIVGGYGSTYILVERSGASISTSEHAKYIEDMTVAKATARYDGKPAIGEDFVATNIKNIAPTTSVTFVGQQEQESTANETQGQG